MKGSDGGVGHDSGDAADVAADGGADIGPDAAAAGDAADDVADAGPGSCPAVTTAPAGPHAARSAGYAGNLTDYSALYNVACTSLQECVDSCVAAGGTTTSCTQGSECIDSSSGPKHCLPPTYWRYGDDALAESPDPNSSAEQTVVVIAYQDPLNVTDFRIAVPAGATIRGIQFDVRRQSDETGWILDDSIRILRDGQPVGTDHKLTDPWGTDLEYVTFGGPTDTWGTTWAPSDFQASGFGIAIADRAAHEGVNARAHVDYVRAQVTYVPASCP